MKRLSLVLLLCLFWVLLIGKGEAFDWESYTVTNETAVRADTTVSTATIIPGKCRILGFRLIPYGQACVDPYLEMHDVATTAGILSTTMFDAMELDTGPLKSDGDWYPSPKKIALGMTVRLGGYTAVVIFYEQYIK